MDADELTELIERRWTAGELVEFLDLDVRDIVDAFSRQLRRNLPSILEELGYDEDEAEAEL
jgi:DNA-directed RNA polymerase specialized sigma subunit